MRSVPPLQKIQDWITQEWVILFGKKITLSEHFWLIGPLGTMNIIGEDYIRHLSEKEKLIIEDEVTTKGLIPSMSKLIPCVTERSRLSPEVIDFYENTDGYQFSFSVKWNSFFRFFGVLISKLFSNRLQQLNIPTTNSTHSEALTSKLITLIDPRKNEPKYTFWLRSIYSNGHPIYSGVYGASTLPSGKPCIKAVFPLPNGNATVLMLPVVGTNGELILESSGNQFGDAGFYFVLKDSKGKYWAKYVRSFRDRLIVTQTQKGLFAEQILTLWHMEVLRFNYTITEKE